MKGWRTIAVNCAIAVVGVLAAVNWSDVAGAEYAGLVAAGISIVNMGLRAITTTPIGQSN